MSPHLVCIPRTRTGLALLVAVAALVVGLLLSLIATPPASAKVKSFKPVRKGQRALVFKPRVFPVRSIRRAKVKVRFRGRTVARKKIGARKVRWVVSKRKKLRIRLRGKSGRRMARITRRRSGKPNAKLKVRFRKTSGVVGAAGPRIPEIDDYLLISAERLASLPTSGTAYNYMKQQADAALANVDIDGAPSNASPWLPNYNDSGSLPRIATRTQAAALVYARTGERKYRDFVIAANRYLIGSENSSSTDGTDDGDRILATARQIAAFVTAADLVEMDPRLTGSRPGFANTSWGSWLDALRTKTIGPGGEQCNTIVQCSSERGHNWGAFATAARVAIDVYLGDQGDLAAAVSRLRRFLGDSSQGSQWKASGAFDSSYACGAKWVAINPASCGPAKNGMIVEDISRSSGSFPSYDKTGISYTMESYQGLLLSAVLLQRQGYGVFQWSDQALRRVMDWLEREGYPQGSGYSTERHQSWVANHFYGEDYPTAPAQMGRSLGFTDWLYG